MTWGNCLWQLCDTHFSNTSGEEEEDEEEVITYPRTHSIVNENGHTIFKTKKPPS